MRFIYIDNHQVTVNTKESLTILEVCMMAGFSIPQFCYHDLLSVSGNCRMCLVEIEEADKPVVSSCTTEIEDNLCVLTDTPLVQKARENVLELLLLNHPLDCPICDQAGECDLQDQAKKYGGNFSKYFFKKKTVEDKYCGPIIKTIMTRCISCTRCVRFNSEIAGSDFYGTLNRGENTEIGSYLPSFFDSEISANVIDLCPVGALTSSAYAAKARPWELRVTETIDVTDPIHTNIYVSHKNTNLMRIVPKPNHNISNGLISDKARYIYESNSINRLIALYGESRITKNKKVNTGWKKFIKRSDFVFDSREINFYINDSLDLETLLLIKKLVTLNPRYFKIINEYNSKLGNYNLGENLHILKRIENSDAAFLFLGANPKIENTLFNAKMRIRANCDDIEIFTMGLSYNYNFLNNFINLNTFQVFTSLNGKANKFCHQFNQASKALIVISENFKNRISCLSTLKTILKNNITKNPIIVDPTNNSNLEAFKLVNLKKNENKNKLKNKIYKDINFFIKSKNTLFLQKHLKASKSTNIWYDTHKSLLEQQMNYSFPATTPFEEEKTYLNMEQRPQKTNKILTISGGCKTFSAVILACFNFDLKQHTYNYVKYISELSEHKNKYNSLHTNMNKSIHNEVSAYKTMQYFYLCVKKYPLVQKIKNFYSTSTSAQNTSILNICASTVVENSKNFLY